MSLKSLFKPTLLFEFTHLEGFQWLEVTLQESLSYSSWSDSCLHLGCFDSSAHHYKLTPWEFLKPGNAGGHSEKFEGQPQKTTIALSVLLDLNNAVVWMVLSLPPVYKCSNLFSKHFGTVPTASPFSACPTVVFLFSSQAGFKYLSIFSLSFIFFFSMSSWNDNIHDTTCSLYFIN